MGLPASYRTKLNSRVEKQAHNIPEHFHITKAWPKIVSAKSLKYRKEPRSQRWWSIFIWCVMEGPSDSEHHLNFCKPAGDLEQYSSFGLVYSSTALWFTQCRKHQQNPGIQSGQWNLLYNAEGHRIWPNLNE